MSAAGVYSGLTERLFHEAPGAGRGSGAGWVQGEAAEPLSGTRVRWHLKVAAGRLAEARYEVRGCPHTVAAAALAAAALAGRPLAAAELDLHDLLRQLSAPPAKLGRFFVIQDALHKALLQIAPGTA